MKTLVKMAKDAASGVLHLHKEGVIHRFREVPLRGECPAQDLHVHRDLAARNLLVDRDLSVK